MLSVSRIFGSASEYQGKVVDIESRLIAPDFDVLYIADSFEDYDRGISLRVRNAQSILDILASKYPAYCGGNVLFSESAYIRGEVALDNNRPYLSGFAICRITGDQGDAEIFGSIAHEEK